MISNNKTGRRTIKSWSLPKYYDILGEKIQQEDKKHPPESRVASKSHLHLHSTPHWGFQLPPAK